MDKLSEAKAILKEIGMPEQQQNDVCAYALLTLAGIRPNDNWSAATNEWIRIHDVLGFAYENYGKEYAENTRETIRKNCMHQFRDSALIEDNGKATNSPNYRYIELLRNLCTFCKRMEQMPFLTDYWHIMPAMKNWSINMPARSA